MEMLKKPGFVIMSVLVLFNLFYFIFKMNKAIDIYINRDLYSGVVTKVEYNNYHQSDFYTVEYKYNGTYYSVQNTTRLNSKYAIGDSLLVFIKRGKPEESYVAIDDIWTNEIIHFIFTLFFCVFYYFMTRSKLTRG